MEKEEKSRVESGSQVTPPTVIGDAFATGAANAIAAATPNKVFLKFVIVVSSHFGFQEPRQRGLLLDLEKSNVYAIKFIKNLYY